VSSRVWSNAGDWGMRLACLFLGARVVLDFGTFFHSSMYGSISSFRGFDLYFVTSIKNVVSYYTVDIEVVTTYAPILFISQVNKQGGTRPGPHVDLPFTPSYPAF
jgi:hypothetical protein